MNAIVIVVLLIIVAIVVYLVVRGEDKKNFKIADFSDHAGTVRHPAVVDDDTVFAEQFLDRPDKSVYNPTSMTPDEVYDDAAYEVTQLRSSWKQGPFDGFKPSTVNMTASAK